MLQEQQKGQPYRRGKLQPQRHGSRWRGQNLGCYALAVELTAVTTAKVLLGYDALLLMLLAAAYRAGAAMHGSMRELARHVLRAQSTWTVEVLQWAQQHSTNHKTAQVRCELVHGVRKVPRTRGNIGRAGPEGERSLAAFGSRETPSQGQLPVAVC